ncbi:SusC/RagA family TonB-linked outer membrane protein [Zunongwangia sp. SCSIO 43204]|uniref:SusC/RagA family TonB-linked outer membrane protein n=1 Tax=Zunongwangia sp. SCSIO 43204 TaxID=2779359 RepID=UPI001CA96D94|nr:SusC/RagA family TonB-linked outer membrane protein [Zunongwangia sp. SCSIO 43204]UAB85014.1 SusC/RagA family TonB-linked outer membrane protein [Zunongwangia sp. SCSIO 43204]|tara:strand:+ start:12304 stop:15282 length:2979 start_codon:yes stop_codon:yes gene_type:complete
MNITILKLIISSRLSAVWLIFLLSLPLLSFSQGLIVKGVVTETSTGAPLPGVNVFVEGTTNGTITDFDGNYQIEVEQGEILNFSFLGFITEKRTVESTTIDVQLKEDSGKLDEVVVIGYGTTTVKDATGSVSSVSEKDFNKGNIVTPENLLSGRVAGLSINTGGAPGSGSTIRIRGGASLGASNDPLIVINGLPVDNNTIGGSRSVLSTINPNDIKSFSVLKDASATAIYGSRASNGVIIITTKQGGSQFRVNFDTQFGINTLPRKVDVFTADEFRELVSEERPDLLSLLGDGNTDWQEEIYRTSLNSSQNLSVSGSIFKNTPARLSLGRTIQEGLRLTSKFERNNVSLTLNPKLFDNHLKISLSANGTYEKNRFAPGEEGNAITFDPTQPVYDVDSPFGGFFQYTNINDDNVLNIEDLTPDAPFNPVANILQRNDQSEVKRFFGNIKFDYQFHFFPDLSAVVNLGYDEQRSDGSVEISDKNPITQPNGQFLGSESYYENYQMNKLFDGYLAYEKEFEDFDLEATAGYSFQKFESNQYVSGELRNDQPDTEPVLTVNTDLVLVGFFARTNLSYKNKYLLTLSLRRDGTSRFSKKNRWGNFPSAAFAWKVKEEFFPQSESLSTLKLRAGYGVTGQQDIGRNNADLFLQRYARGLPASQYQFGDEIIPIGIPVFRNENLKWEETSTYNIGLDYGLFEDRFSGSIEAFYKKSKDLLANVAISDGSNFSNAGFQNVGNFVSQGLEFSINGDIFQGNSDHFSWNVNFNTTFIDTEIKTLALNQDQLVGGISGGTGNTAQIHRVGYTPYSYYVYKQVYNEQGRPIEGGYADLNGDNIINDNDRYIFQNGQPDVTMGFLSNMYYRGFDFSFNLRANLGQYNYNNINSSRAQLSLLENNAVVSNLPTSVLNTGFNNTEDVILSDHYIEEASFLKMDNISLGYTFENAWSDNSSVRISAGVQNVFIITNYSGLDPEVFENGIDNTLYPRSRTFILGANIRL